MLQAMIIDDEVQIRKGLRMKVDWEREGFAVVTEASNGQDALDKLKQHDIDVVISDVRMPIMDGIEFAQRCKAEYSDVKIIILSGYSEFDYAKSSIQAGVKDYLLKPVAPDELRDALQKLRKEIEAEKKEKSESEKLTRLVHDQLEEIREKYLLSLVKEGSWQTDNVVERMQQLKLDDFADPQVTVQFITVENRLSPHHKYQDDERWLNFKRLCADHAKDSEGTRAFYDGSYRNMIHFIKTVKQTPVDQESFFIRELQSKVKKQLKLETVVGIGRVVTGHAEFKNGYISSLLSWSQSQTGSSSQIVEAEDKNEMFEFSGDFEKKITNALENLETKSFKKYIDETLNGYSQSMMSFSFTSNKVLFLLGSIADKYDMRTRDIQQAIWNCQQTIWELTSQSKVIEQLKDTGEMIIGKISDVRFSTSGAEIVENVRKFIDSHYADQISLSKLSELFHINSTYLSEIFKLHVGMNFSEYLNHLRLENAKSFLKDDQLKIIDIAHLVGFSNSGYFSTVFKKHYGQTPADFRSSSLK